MGASAGAAAATVPVTVLGSAVALPPQIAPAATVAAPLAVAAVIAGCGTLSLAHYRALPPVLRWQRGMTGHPLAGAPSVSVVVPARNEERNLPKLLRSLIALDYPAYEVIVVDDASTDATPAIADRYAADTEGLVRALHLAGPDPGWTGKTWACWQGAQAARGGWLLFTDADTEHEYGSLRAAVWSAHEAGTAALSLFPRQQCLSFWERLLLPFAYQQYFVGVRPRRLSRPTGSALANGQYFLIQREAYAACGGHAAVAGSIIDDVALAGALKRAGYSPLVCHGEELVRVRMYTGLRALVAGFQKNALQFLRQQGLAGALVVLSTACNTGILAALAWAIYARSPLSLGAAVLAYGAQVALLMPWERAFGVRRAYALLAPLAALAFTLIALASMLRVLTGRRVFWKGRRYPARGGALQPMSRRGAVGHG
ncbi:MAG TPA: glycosyltransferase [Ktedonobacterales bacterium]